MTFKVGDMIKTLGTEEDEYGYVAKEDDKYFWIYWFDDVDSREHNYLFRKYSKKHDWKTFKKVS
jgi:hypothetical protein